MVLNLVKLVCSGESQYRIQGKGLKWMATTGDFWQTFVTFYKLSQTPIPFWKGVYSIRKEFAPSGEWNPFKKGTKTILISASPESVSIPLKSEWHETKGSKLFPVRVDPYHMSPKEVLALFLIINYQKQDNAVYGLTCMAVNPVMVGNFNSFFNCTTVSQSSDYMTIHSQAL